MKKRVLSEQKNAFLETKNVSFGAPFPKTHVIVASPSCFPNLLLLFPLYRNYHIYFSCFFSSNWVQRMWSARMGSKSISMDITWFQTWPWNGQRKLKKVQISLQKVKKTRWKTKLFSNDLQKDYWWSRAWRKKCQTRGFSETWMVSS